MELAPDFLWFFSSCALKLPFSWNLNAYILSQHKFKSNLRDPCIADYRRIIFYLTIIQADVIIDEQVFAIMKINFCYFAASKMKLFTTILVNASAMCCCMVMCCLMATL